MVAAPRTRCTGIAPDRESNSSRIRRGRAGLAEPGALLVERRERLRAPEGLVALLLERLHLGEELAEDRPLLLELLLGDGEPLDRGPPLARRPPELTPRVVDVGAERLLALARADELALEIADEAEHALGGARRVRGDGTRVRLRPRRLRDLP